MSMTMFMLVLSAVAIIAVAGVAILLGMALLKYVRAK